MKRKNEAYQSINIAPTHDQAKIVWLKAHSMLQSPRCSWMVRQIRMTPFPTIQFFNGSEFQCRSSAGGGSRLLGHAFDDVNWDEAALEKRFTEIMDNVIRMRMVDRGGKIDITSTGQGRNQFGLYFLDGLAGKRVNTYCQVGSSFENNHINQDALKAAMAHMSERMRRQNIDGAIIDGGGGYFVIEDVEACENAELNDHAATVQDEEDDYQIGKLELRVGSNTAGFQTWVQKYPDHQYLHGWDLAEKEDRTVGVTFDLSVKPWKLVEFHAFRRKGWDYVFACIRERDKRYRTKRATKIDSTGLGDVVENTLKDIDVEGVNFGGAGKKDALLANLASVLSQRKIEMPLIMRMHNELAFYERDDKQLETDCVMSLAVAMWFAEHKQKVYAFATSV